MESPFQVLVDCPACRVEGAVLELVQPTEGDQGVVLESTCRMCGRSVQQGRCVDPGRRFATPEQGIEALRAWAEREQEPDLELFARANFGDRRPAEIAEALVQRRPVTTNFDAVAWLFPGTLGPAQTRNDETGPAGERAAGDAVDAGPQQAAGPRAPGPTAAALAAARAEDHARTAARALIAVMVGDGVIRPEERAFIDRCMHSFGYPPMTDFDLRPWRPSELGPPHDTAALVEAMAALVYVDHERDGSEWRIVREFARYWGYPMEHLETLEQQLEQQYAPRTRRLVLALRRLLFKES